MQDNIGLIQEDIRLIKADTHLISGINRRVLALENPVGPPGGQNPAEGNSLLGAVERPRAQLADAPSITAAHPDDPRDATEHDGDTSQVIDSSLWTLESAKDLGIYYREPAILEATQILAKYFQEGATRAPGTAAKELRKIPTDLRDKFIAELLKKSRSDWHVEPWKNFWSRWISYLKAKTANQKTLDYKAIMVAAFKESAENAPKLGQIIEDDHDKSVQGSLTGGAGGAGAAGTSAGGASSYGHWHHHWFVPVFPVRAYYRNQYWKSVGGH